MNFKPMPELEWSLGYPLALVLMLIAASPALLVFQCQRLAMRLRPAPLTLSMRRDSNRCPGWAAPLGAPRALRRPAFSLVPQAVVDVGPPPPPHGPRSALLMKWSSGWMGAAPRRILGGGRKVAERIKTG